MRKGRGGVQPTGCRARSSRRSTTGCRCSVVIGLATTASTAASSAGFLECDFVGQQNDRGHVLPDTRRSAAMPAIRLSQSLLSAPPSRMTSAGKYRAAAFCSCVTGVSEIGFRPDFSTILKRRCGSPASARRREPGRDPATRSGASPVKVLCWSNLVRPSGARNGHAGMPIVKRLQMPYGCVRAT